MNDKEIAPQDSGDDENGVRFDEPIIVDEIVPTDFVLLGACLRRSESTIKGIAWTGSDLAVSSGFSHYCTRSHHSPRYLWFL
jgi:hypothetical protein